MAKYNWIELEREYILGDYKSLNAFLKENNIPDNGNTKKSTKGWKDKKVLKENEKSTKVLKKVIEKESTKEAKEKVTINEVAEKLLNRIVTISTKVDNPQGLKSLSSALRDLKELTEDSKEINQNTLAKEIEEAWRNRNV